MAGPNPAERGGGALPGPRPGAAEGSETGECFPVSGRGCSWSPAFLSLLSMGQVIVAHRFGHLSSPLD